MGRNRIVSTGLEEHVVDSQDAKGVREMWSLRRMALREIRCPSTLNARCRKVPDKGR